MNNVISKAMIEGMCAIRSITKEMIEEQLDYEIDSYTCEPIYVNEEFVGISVRVKPKNSTSIIESKVIVLKTGEIVDHDFTQS